MTSLIAVGGIDSGANQSVLHVVSSGERCIGVRAIIRIYIDCEIKFLAFGGIDQICDNLISIWSAGVFCADGHLMFCAGKSVSNTAHIDRQHLRDI